MNRKKFINGCMHEFMIDSLKKKSLSKALYPELSIAEAKYICGCVYDDMKHSHNKTKKNLKKFVKQCSLNYKPKRRSRSRRRGQSRTKRPRKATKGMGRTRAKLSSSKRSVRKSRKSRQNSVRARKSPRKKSQRR